MDPILELLRELGFDVSEDLGVLTDEQIADAEEALQGAYQEARDNRDLDRAEAIVTAVEAIRTEAETRISAAEEAEARFAELDQRVTPSDETVEGDGDDDGEGDGDGDEEDAGDGDAPAETEAEAEEAEEEAETPPAPEAEQRERVAASAIRTRPRREAALEEAQKKAARRMPRATPERQASPAPARRATVTAGADLRGYSPGDPIPDLKALGNAWGDRMQVLQSAARGNPHAAGKFVLASVSIIDEIPEERWLSSDPVRNMELIAKAQADAQKPDAEAIVAAGGLCAPLVPDYDLYGVGNDRRPIRDGILRFGADRGGITYVRPPVLANMGGAVDIFTEAEDAATPVKPCLTVTCGTTVEETVSAVTKCLQIGNWNRRFWPEQFARFWALAGIEHAREAETDLWDSMVADSTAVTTGEVLGAARDIIENLIQAAAAYRNRHRMDPDETLRAIGPDWVPALMAADLLRQLPGDNTYAVSLQQITQWLAVHNIAVTWSPDVTGNIFGAQNAAALLRWPDTVDFLLFSEGSFLFLDGGVLDLGLEIRDSTLNAANNVQAFSETFEGVAFVGVESLRIRMNVCPDGSSSAAVDISPCTTGS